MECPNPHCEAALPSAAKACPACRLPLPGVLFQGRYAITHLVVRGEHVFRYQASDRETEESVELIVLVAETPQARARFLQEARSLSRLEIEGIQRVRAVIEAERPAAVLDPIRGHASTDLAPVSEPELLGVAFQTAKTLSLLHDRRILHRSLMPDHLRLNRDREVTLVGWGWERMLALQAGSPLERLTSAEQDFVAPEVASLHAFPKSDVYGLGMSLIALATGMAPAKLYHPTTRTYQWRDHARLSDEFAAVIEAMIEPATGKRLATMRRVCKHLLRLFPAELQANGLEESFSDEPLLSRLGIAWTELELDARWAWPLALLVLLFPMLAAEAPGLPPVVKWAGRTLVDPPSRGQAPNGHENKRTYSLSRRLVPTYAQGHLRGGTAPSATSSPELPRAVMAVSGAQAVEVRISRRFHLLEVYSGSIRVMGFEVGLGASGSTPIGRFRIESKAEHPDYRDPKGGVVLGSDPHNPLGTRWLGLEVPGRQGIGIHGTPYRDSIGDDQSLGCIRMQNEDVETLYTAIPAHTWVTIEP